MYISSAEVRKVPILALISGNMCAVVISLGSAEAAHQCTMPCWIALWTTAVIEKDVKRDVDRGSD